MYEGASVETLPEDVHATEFRSGSINRAFHEAQTMRGVAVRIK